MKKTKFYKVFPMSHDVFDSDVFKSLFPCSKILYCYLAKLSNWLANDSDSFYRSMKNLAKDTGLNINSVKRGKKELLANGLIEVQPERHEGLGCRLADRYKVIIKIASINSNDGCDLSIKNAIGG